jgi:hypothetical protein
MINPSYIHMSIVESINKKWKKKLKFENWNEKEITSNRNKKHEGMKQTKLKLEKEKNKIMHMKFDV